MSDMQIRYATHEEQTKAHEPWKAEEERKKQRNFEHRVFESIQGARTNPYWGCAGTVSRPTIATKTVDGRQMFTEEQLVPAQVKWDEAKAPEDQFAARQAEKQAADDARKQDADKALTEQRAKERDALLTPAREAFLRGGGSEADWKAQEASIEADIRRELAVKAATGQGETDEQRRIRRQYQRNF